MWIMSACVVEISHWIEYAWGVKSETVTLDRRVDLRCDWTWFLSDEIHGCILRVSLEYASRVLGYDTLSGYRLDSLSIPGWLERDTILDQSQESWEVDSDSLVHRVYLTQSCWFVTLVSGAPEIDKQLIIEIKLGGSGAPENTNLVCRSRCHNSTQTIWHKDA